MIRMSWYIATRSNRSLAHSLGNYVGSLVAFRKHYKPPHGAKEKTCRQQRKSPQHGERLSDEKG